MEKTKLDMVQLRTLLKETKLLKLITILFGLTEKEAWVCELYFLKGHSVFEIQAAIGVRSKKSLDVIKAFEGNVMRTGRLIVAWAHALKNTGNLKKHPSVFFSEYKKLQEEVLVLRNRVTIFEALRENKIPPAIITPEMATLYSTDLKDLGLDKKSMQLLRMNGVTDFKSLDEYQRAKAISRIKGFGTLKLEQIKKLYEANNIPFPPQPKRRR